MRFDDRLLTVLNLPTPEPRDRAVQWRQLVELVARDAAGADETLLHRALDRLAEIGGEVPLAVRAAAARAVAGSAVPAALVVLFAADRADIAAPLLTAAELDPAEWAEVEATASPEVQALLAVIRPKTSLPEPAPPPVLADPPAPAAAPPPLVVPPPAEPVLPAGNSPVTRALPAVEAGLFRWECGPDGEIDWVDGAPRAALIGRRIADELEGRFAARLPFSDEALASAEDGPLAGEWRWSGTPAFVPATGRFAGYRGIARRQAQVAGATDATALATTVLDGDALRELVHELRTPLNAIIGFGEMIDGQFLGPAHSAYRARAGEIVRQAQRLVGAVNDLDFAAKLQSGRAARGLGSGVADIFPVLRQHLGAHATMRGVSLRVSVRALDDRLAPDRELAERLITRFGESVIDAAAPGEHLEMSLERVGRQFAVAIDRPAAIRGLPQAALLDPAFAVGDDAGLGLGFALRLVRGLASMAGGRLDLVAGRVVLLIPLAEG